MRFIVIYVNTAGSGFASHTGKRLISFAPGKQTQGRPGISSLPALRFAKNSGQRVEATVPGKTQLSRKFGLAKSVAGEWGAANTSIWSRWGGWIWD